MSKPNKPTLIFPNGNENILGRVIEISWQEPVPISTDGSQVWYEIYFTDYFRDQDRPDWMHIGSVPSSENRFRWKVGNSFFTDKARFGVLAVNASGERSDLSISANDVSIRRKQALAPSILSPTPGGRYGDRVEIILDNSALKNTVGQKAKYYIFFSSRKLNIPLSPIAQKIPVDTGPIIWNTSLIEPSDDYVVTIYLADDTGNKSPEVNINNIEIVNEGFFLIDTKPPSGFLEINNGADFTKKREVAVRIFAFDETTGAHAMRLKEEGLEFGPPESVEELKFHQLTPEDGSKTLQASFQDYGGNRTSQIEKKFRTIFSNQNQDIADISYDSSDNSLWIGLNGSEAGLFNYKNTVRLATSVDRDILALSVFGNNVYLSFDNSDENALIYRFTGSRLQEAINLKEPQTKIISMSVYRNNLYLGSIGGDLYQYNESSINLIKTFESSIQDLYADNSLLFISLKNSNNFHVFDGEDFTEIGSE